MFEIAQVEKAEHPALLFSGGKDSLLLLDIVRKIRPVTIIHFYDRLHPEVERILKLWDLDILSWQPAHQYFIPFGDDPALVSEYSFGAARLPVVTGIMQSKDKCEIEKLRFERMPHFDYPFDVTLWGYKRGDDRHPIMGEAFPICFDLGTTRMLAPLYHWSDEDVLSEIARRELPYEPFSDELKMCEKCKGSLGAWDKETSLQFFANRFNFKEAA